MRRLPNHTPYFTALVLIVTLTISFMHVPMAASQDPEEIILELRKLQDDVSKLPLDKAFENTHSAKGQRNALTNKIKAVINQIEAGNYKGSINKLENDLKKTVEAWITEDYESDLINKIDRIIKLIKGERPPDFSLKASPTSLTIALGESDSSTITITSSYGFSELVYLAVFGVPSGVTATLDPTQVTPPPDGFETSNLTVNVDITAVVGSYVLTVTGTSGIPEHSVNVILKITELPPLPDFAISASPTSLTIQQGDSGSSTITVSSLNGFSALVDLAVTSLPITGVTTTLDPTQVTPPPDGTETSMLSVQVELSALPGTYTLTVTGTSGGITHSTDVTLKITEIPPTPDFSIEASPTSLTIEQGDSDTATITTTSLNGFNQPVQLSVSGVPSGVTVTLDPEEVTPPADGTETSNLTVSVDISATPGLYTLTVTGTSNLLQRSTDVYLEITELPPQPDFSIEANPDSLTISQGGSDISIITVTSINGFNDPVALTVSPAIVGVTYSLDPSVVTPPASGEITSTVIFAVAETAALNTYMLVLTGTSGNLQRNASLSLKITPAPPPPDLEPPTVRIVEPANGSYVAGLVNIVVFMYDRNFKRAELTINNILIASWTAENVSTGKHSVSWDTTLPEYPDGLYNITLSAEDEAGNDSEKTHIVTVDNTKPTATIDAPAEASYLRGSVLIRVTGEDNNFYKMNLEIDNVSVKNWTTSGSQLYEWNTEADGIDGTHTITLTAYDKAGNSDESSVTVIVDNTLPTVRIDKPAEGSYLAGIIDIEVFIQEANLEKAELTINGTEVASWTLSGEHVFNWDTTTYAEGIYIVKLSALDKAGNIGEKTTKVTVDNRAPIALIHWPKEGSYLRGTVLMNVTGYDTNFERMELRIGDVLPKTWTTYGYKEFPWNTTAYSDGAYKLTLTVYDKADSSKEVSVTVNVDNTSPIIEAVAWTPKEPSTGEQVNVTVKVSDPQPGSGIQSVTLWYKNTTMEDWQPISMSLNVTSGNWTATIPAQSMETTIEFYIEAFDNAGNKAISDEYEYKVIAPAGIPLAWIVAIILLILAATAAAIYLWRRRRREKQGASSSRVKNYKLTILLCV